MYTVTKRMEIAGSHSLCLNYESPCQRVHGHNWIITVEIKSEILNSNGMIIDFSRIKSTVNLLDHQNINDVIDINPTAENIAAWIYGQITCELTGQGCDAANPAAFVSKVTVQESEGNTACYMP